MIVLDAHVWVWWLHDPSTLTATGRRAVEEARETGSLIVSSIGVWDMAMLAV